MRKQHIGSADASGKGHTNTPYSRKGPRRLDECAQNFGNMFYMYVFYEVRGKDAI